jgi:hypothetical protein
MFLKLVSGVSDIVWLSSEEDNGEDVSCAGQRLGKRAVRRPAQGGEAARSDVVSSVCS